ncbi:hypothetical protein ACOME3_008768 [Neoechinorhynchus agilis]
MNGERESAKYFALRGFALKCFERVTETLKDSLIEVMSTIKDVLAEAIRFEMEALYNEQLIEVKKCKGCHQYAKFGLLETNGVLKTANISTFTMDSTPPLEDIQHVVLYDPKIVVEYDIVTGIIGNDMKSEKHSAEVTTKKATVEQKLQVTPERVVSRAKGGTPSKSINPPIHFCNDTPSPPRPSSLAALDSTHRIMHSSLDDRNRTIFISGMPEAPVTDPVAADAHNRHQILRIGQLLFPDIHYTIPPPLAVMRIPSKNSFNPRPRLLKVTFISPFVASCLNRRHKLLTSQLSVRIHPHKNSSRFLSTAPPNSTQNSSSQFVTFSKHPRTSPPIPKDRRISHSPVSLITCNSTGARITTKVNLPAVPH